AIADPRAKRAGRADRFEQIEGDRELQHPDRLEVGGEKRTRWPEHVVAVRIREVTLAVFLEHLPRERRERRIDAERGQRRRVYGALGQPELVPRDPPPVVALAAPDGAINRAAVRVRVERIEGKRSAVFGTAAAIAGKERFIGRNGQRTPGGRVRVGAERFA